MDHHEVVSRVSVGGCVLQLGLSLSVHVSKLGVLGRPNQEGTSGGALNDQSILGPGASFLLEQDGDGASDLASFVKEGTTGQGRHGIGGQHTCVSGMQWS